jgi:hypothetical protein
MPPLAVQFMVILQVLETVSIAVYSYYIYSSSRWTQTNSPQIKIQGHSSRIFVNSSRV